MYEIETLEKDFVGARFRTTFPKAKAILTNQETIVSETFIFRDIPWNIRLRGASVNSIFGGNDVICCFYLDCLETDPGFSFKASYKVSAIRVSQPPFEKEKTFTFDANVRSDGIVPFFSLSEFYDTIGIYSFCDSLTMHIELKTELPPTIMLENFDYLKVKLIQSLQPSTINDVIKDLDALLRSGDGDVTFKLKDGFIIKAHKSILCARNAVFATMLSVDMKEAKTMEVTIDDMGKDALITLLIHVYTGQLSLNEELDEDSCKEVAEKYNLPELKEVAGLALAEVAMNNPGNAFDNYKFLKRYNVDTATKALASYIMSNTKEMLDKC